MLLAGFARSNVPLELNTVVAFPSVVPVGLEQRTFIEHSNLCTLGQFGHVVCSELL